MSDTFLLGAGFSKAICKTMPTMKELYELLETRTETPILPKSSFS